MRNLNSKTYPPHRTKNYSLIDIIVQECFQGCELGDLDKFKLKSQLIHPSTILWILDGCDERTTPDHLYLIEQELFAKPHLLLTSRPYSIHDFRYDARVRIQGFTYQDIESYITRYFSIMLQTTATECWSFISCSDQLQQTARIPACLEIICSLWESGKEKFELGMTTGEIYQKMCEHLLHRYLLKFHGQCPSSLAGRDIYKEPNALAFMHLEQLAFKATKSHQFTVSGDEVSNVAGPLFLSVLQIGLLIPKTRNPSPVLTGNIYYFVHRSFQEYLCARYMIRALTLDCSKEQKKEVMQFITYEKYNRDVRDTFRLFFELKRSVLCTNQFWSAVDSEPCDLVGLRHCSRIRQWFSHGTCVFSPEDEQKIDRRTTEPVLTWILNKERSAHDYANTYLFEWFAEVIGQDWVTAWKEDLMTEDASKRRYFLLDLWSEKNIDALKTIYDEISKNMFPLRHLITTGPTRTNLKHLHPYSDALTLHAIDDQAEVSEFIIAAEEKAKRQESISTLAEFQTLLQNYISYAEVNFRAMALGEETSRLTIAPSALTDINDDTLQLLLRLLKQNVLFFREFKLPVISFVELYAKQRNFDDDLLRRLIVSITMSSGCLLTALPGQKTVIRVHEDKTPVDFELDQERGLALIREFKYAREVYGYSSFFIQDV